MKIISAFDVVGPEMIGPSSSHTAGALKIAQLARNLAGNGIVKVVFVLYGSFAKTYQGHGTDKALTAGILGFSANDRRIRDAIRLAQKSGLAVSFEADTEDTPIHPNTVDVVMTMENGTSMTVTGISVGGGKAYIVKINGEDISLSGEYCTLFVHQKDSPGVMAHITTAFRDTNLNIATMRLFRTKKGQDAYSVIESDDAIPEEVVNRIMVNPDIYIAKIITL